MKMSLNVNLKIGKNYVFQSNITHNLNVMAKACGVYYACWRPEEINCKKAKHILPMLIDGILLLQSDPVHYEKFNSSNGWGLYKNFLPWLKEYCNACEKYPNANISVSR